MNSSIVPRISRRYRISKKRNLRSGKWLIVCGALETEINYIRELIDKVNKYCPINQKIIYELKAIPLDPKNLVEKIKREITICSEKLDIRFSKIFVVFDKDDFNDKDYNKAIKMCDENDYIPLYSNECIELWFYFHFNYIDVSINRFDLINKINEIFEKNNIGKYHKNDKSIFDKLYNHGDILKAITRAYKLSEIANINEHFKAKQKPVTNIYKLLDEIEIHQQEFNLPSIYEIFKK